MQAEGDIRTSASLTSLPMGPTAPLPSKWYVLQARLTIVIRQAPEGFRVIPHAPKLPLENRNPWSTYPRLANPHPRSSTKHTWTPGLRAGRHRNFIRSVEARPNQIRFLLLTPVLPGDSGTRPTST